MNNEQEQLEQPQQVAPAVTPPPFRPSEEQQEPQPQEQGTSPTLADRIEVMELDEESKHKLQELTAGIATNAVTEALLATLARGLTHDEDVQNADAAGYLRGRNEKIEAVLHQQPQDEEEEIQATPVFPRYCRRSIWD